MAISGTSFPSLPSVFISSTVRDLHDLRTAVAYNLRSQGFIVNLSEDPDFDVRGDRPAIDECLENVRAKSAISFQREDIPSARAFGGQKSYRVPLAR